MSTLTAERPARYEVSGPTGRVAGCERKIAAYSVAMARAMREGVPYVVRDTRARQGETEAWHFDETGEMRRVAR